MDCKVKLAVWVAPWAKQTAKKLRNLSSVDSEERYQEIAECYLKNKKRVDEIASTQGEKAAKAYLGMVVVNHLKNLNAELCTQLSGMGGATRSADSESVRKGKLTAMTGGISLNMASDEGCLSDIIPSNQKSIEESMDMDLLIEKAGILAPLLTGQIESPKEWCRVAPGAAKILTDNLPLREMAVRQAAAPLAKLTGRATDEVVTLVLDFLKDWRGARGDYGDGDCEASEAIFTPCKEVADLFPNGSVMREIALCSPLESIEQYKDGFGRLLLQLVRKEAKDLEKSGIIEKGNGFCDYCVNRTYSYLKANNGLLKYEAVMERLQQSLF